MKRKNINLNKLSDIVRKKGFCTEEAALHLMDEIKELREKLENIENKITSDLTIEELHMVKGRLDLTATHPLAETIIASLVSVFKSAGAENYLELEAYREDVGPVTITIQRRFGKTPGQIAQELREEIKQLKKD